MKSNKKPYTRGTSSDQNSRADTRFLTRIITYLLEVKESATKSELKKNIPGINGSKLKDALNWLRGNRIIIKRRQNEDRVEIVNYTINEKWKMMMEDYISGRNKNE